MQKMPRETLVTDVVAEIRGAFFVSFQLMLLKRQGPKTSEARALLRTLPKSN